MSELNFDMYEEEMSTADDVNEQMETGDAVNPLVWAQNNVVTILAGLAIAGVTAGAAIYTKKRLKQRGVEKAKQTAFASIFKSSNVSLAFKESISDEELINTDFKGVMDGDNFVTGVIQVDPKTYKQFIAVPGEGVNLVVTHMKGEYRIHVSGETEVNPTAERIAEVLSGCVVAGASE